MTNVSQFPGQPTRAARTAVPVQDLLSALVVYSAMKPDPARTKELLQIVRGGMNLNHETLEVTVTAQVVQWIEELKPRDRGDAAWMMQMINTGITVQEAADLLLKHRRETDTLLAQKGAAQE